MNDCLIRVNGEEQTYPCPPTLREVVTRVTGAEWTEDGRATAGLGLAVALDGAIVPRSRWASTTVPAGARVELVGAVQGG